MCIILVTKHPTPDYKLILVANRDEYHTRKTSPLSYWSDYPEIVGGKDLVAGGSWLAVSTSGRLAAITNISAIRSSNEPVASRGLIVRNFLAGKCSVREYSDRLKAAHHAYDGFNLVIYHQDTLYWDSNTVNMGEELSLGLHTVSNAPLHTEWLKTEKLRAKFSSVLASNPVNLCSQLFEILGPDLTGRQTGQFEENLRNEIFIKGETYGTRCSSIVLFRTDGTIGFTERSYNKGGECTEEKMLKIIQA